MGLEQNANTIETAVFKTIAEGKASSLLSSLLALTLFIFSLYFLFSLGAMY